MAESAEHQLEKRPRNSKKKNKEIAELLEKLRHLIESEALIVYILDEYHLVWGNVCGMVWGPTQTRVEIPIVNQRERQTYYGALNYWPKEFTLMEF
ncbi:hypothetical protein [Microcoleus sp. FACHB-672]|uniref:hypothetical protein n=1 Tax=Microcoleus sp. FACHB-672 TaxID=2692825 RepID=UPI001681F18D|nr:hypothetical protein [Microcoleus sp. FACHB-672]MBD2043322.1 hypothetical protein [Microcoleus sp. FACHB-672]